MLNIELHKCSISLTLSLSLCCDSRKKRHKKTQRHWNVGGFHVAVVFMVQNVLFTTTASDKTIKKIQLAEIFQPNK